ncbi:MAG: LysR family transcriptional regulator [Myxococcota bacterium]|nr:LysR family transcriptional regulator [Myxococcota bacterium]
MPQLPDVDSLRCFLAAAELPTFRASAAKVALSPAAFSERIQRLEADLGSPLFTRTTRRIELTEAGRALLPAARQVLRSLESCVAAVDPSAQALPFELTLGTRYELGLSWLVPALPTLDAAHPERTLHLGFGDSPDLLRALSLGQADAAITSVRLSQGGLDTAPLHEEHYRLVTCPGCVLGAPGLERLDTASDLPLWRYLLDAHPAAADWDFSRTRILGTIGAVRARLLASGGLAVLPEYFVRQDLAQGRLIQPLPKLTLRSDHFRLVWRKGHHRAAQLRALAQELAAIPLR